MNPVFRRAPQPGGELLTIEPESGASARDAVEETWIHVQLSPSVEPQGARRRRTAAAQRAGRRPAGGGRLGSDDRHARGLAEDLTADRDGRYPGPDRAGRRRAAALAGRRQLHAAGLPALPGAGRHGPVDESNSLGVLRGRKNTCRELTDDNKLLMLAQATVPSYLRYGAYPYIVVVRENGDGRRRRAPLHRPVHRRRHERRRAGDPGDLRAGSARRWRWPTAIPAIPGQLLLDIIQTIPRSELFALSAERLLAMAKAVVDLGSRRRTLLFVRADRLEHFVSCLVYLPRDRYTTAVRLEIEDILVREFGGAAWSSPPGSANHLGRWCISWCGCPRARSAPPASTPPRERDRIQSLLTEAARTWADRLIGAAANRCDHQADRRALRDGFFRGLQAGRHPGRRDRPTSPIIEGLS